MDGEMAVTEAWVEERVTDSEDEDYPLIVTVIV